MSLRRFTLLLHAGAIFSGSTDEKIICWEYSTHNALYAMTGHEGAIVSLASNSSYVASSSADLTIRLWMKHTNVNAVGNVGQQVRVVYGHVKSVLSLQLGESWMLSGSADFEVRVWTLSHSSKNSLLVDSTNRLQGHECPITCVSYGSLEVRILSLRDDKTCFLPNYSFYIFLFPIERFLVEI